MVVSKDGCQAQRFLAVDVYQMSLVEPESKRLGWGVVKFAGLLQVSARARAEKFPARPFLGLSPPSASFVCWFSASQPGVTSALPPPTWSRYFF